MAWPHSPAAKPAHRNTTLPNPPPPSQTGRPPAHPRKSTSQPLDAAGSAPALGPAGRPASQAALSVSAASGPPRREPSTTATATQAGRAARAKKCALVRVRQRVRQVRWAILFGPGEARVVRACGSGRGAWAQGGLVARSVEGRLGGRSAAAF